MMVRKERMVVDRVAHRVQEEDPRSGCGRMPGVVHRLDERPFVHRRTVIAVYAIRGIPNEAIPSATHT